MAAAEGGRPFVELRAASFMDGSVVPVHVENFELPKPAAGMEGQRSIVQISISIFAASQLEIRNHAPGRGYPHFPCGKFKVEDQRGSVPYDFPCGRN